MNRLRFYKKELLAEIKMLRFNLTYTFTRKLRVIYIGCTDSNNLGDEAVFIALNKMLKKRFFLYKVSYTKPSSGRYFRKIIFKKPDYILLGGGTLIIKGEKEGFLKLVNSFKIKFPNAKTIILGTGVANPELAALNGFPTDFSGWRKFIDDSIFVGLRGQESIKTIKEKIKSTSNPVVFYDPAIYFFNSKITKKRKVKSIGINFCNLENRLFGHNKEQVEIFFKTLIVKLIANDWEVHLYPTAKNDFNYMSEVLKFTEVDYVSLKFHNYEENIIKSLKVYNDFDVFIGQRLHSIVFSAVTHTPFFAIEYESKMSDFLSSLDILEKPMRTDNLNVDFAYKKINKIFNNLDFYQKELYLKSENIFNSQKDCLDSFFRLID